jgi:hypothetical protein
MSDNDTRAAPRHREPPAHDPPPTKVVEPLSQPMVARSADVCAVAQVLALSDERDQWTNRLLAAERAAYLAGAATGWRLGLERGARIRQADWPEIVKPLDAPSAAELELLRWGPGGRERFADRRPGDYTPPTRLEAAS